MQERPDRPAVDAGTAVDGGTFREAVFGAARAQVEAANTTDMRPYWVRHLRGNIVECQFEALAFDSLACATDHPPPDGCRVAVMPLEEWRDRCAQQQREATSRAMNCLKDGFAAHYAQVASADGDLTAKELAEIDREFGIDRRNLERALAQRAPSRGFA